MKGGTSGSVSTKIAASENLPNEWNIYNGEKNK